MYTSAHISKPKHNLLLVSTTHPGAHHAGIHSASALFCLSGFLSFLLSCFLFFLEVFTGLFQKAKEKTSLSNRALYFGPV